MLALTTNISIPNITKVHCYRVDIDQDLSVAIVHLKVQMNGGNLYQTFLGQNYALQITNGPCTALIANPSSVGVYDIVTVVPATDPTGFTDLVAAFTTTGAGNINAKNNAVESVLMAAGLLPPAS